LERCPGPLAYAGFSLIRRHADVFINVINVSYKGLAPAGSTTHYRISTLRSHASVEGTTRRTRRLSSITVLVLDLQACTNA
jgi:hypothetical protein